MNNLFIAFHQPDFEKYFYDDDKSLFVYDANLLLDIAKIFDDDEEAAAIGALKHPKNIYIPYFVGVEFEYNFENTVNQQSKNLKKYN